MAVGIGETITVINKSGKVVSNSKHIVNVFKEAKAAYRERKAEINANRDAAIKEKELAKSVKLLRDDDDTRSRASGRSKASRAHTSRSKAHHDRPTLERGYTDSFYVNDSPRGSRGRLDRDLAGEGRDAHIMEITRRNSDQRVQKTKDVDLDLAYGDVPPPLPVSKYDDGELKEKASKIEMLLDEANCLQYSATAMIENLQKNPEALAAVSLTLAEISSIVGKMGPGVLTSLKCSFPAVAALLVSPQFMIAGGVAVGVTIVALGGYKIIKKMQSDNAAAIAAKEDQGPPIAMAMRVDSHQSPPQAIEDSNNQLDELEPQELSRVEKWRRGIAEVEANSAAISVDGEFITPGASRTLCAAGVLDEDDLKSRRSTRSRREKDGESRAPKSHRAKSVKSERTARTEKTGKTEKTEKTVKTSKTEKTSDSKKPSKSSDSKKPRTIKEGSTTGSTSTKKKEKEPSGLKMLFRAHTAHV